MVASAVGESDGEIASFAEGVGPVVVVDAAVVGSAGRPEVGEGGVVAVERLEVVDVAVVEGDFATGGHAGGVHGSEHDPLEEGGEAGGGGLRQFDGLAVAVEEDGDDVGAHRQFAYPVDGEGLPARRFAGLVAARFAEESFEAGVDHEGGAAGVTGGVAAVDQVDECFGLQPFDGSAFLGRPGVLGGGEFGGLVVDGGAGGGAVGGAEGAGELDESVAASPHA